MLNWYLTLAHEMGFFLSLFLACKKDDRHLDGEVFLELHHAVVLSVSVSILSSHKKMTESIASHL